MIGLARGVQSDGKLITADALTVRIFYTFSPFGARFHLPPTRSTRDVIPRLPEWLVWMSKNLLKQSVRSDLGEWLMG